MKNKLLTIAAILFVAYKMRGPLTYLLMKHTNLRYTEDIRVSMSEEDFDEEQHNLNLRYQMPLNLEMWSCPECKAEFLVSWNELVEKFVITTSTDKVPVHRIGGIAFVWPDINKESKKTNTSVPEITDIKRMLGDLGEHI